MEPLLAHQRAQDVFAGVLAGVTPDQLSRPTPCSEWSVRDLIDHVIGGNERVVQRAGMAPGTVSRPSDLAAAHRASSAAAQAIFAAPDGLTRTFDLPIGEVPGQVFVRIRALDAFAHAWDLAQAAGQPIDFDPELAAQLLESARQIIRPELRGAGKPFGLEQSCPANAAPATQLATFLGRQPELA
ncbi:MAG: TIGR03086 family metal-binding protein [Chloroflexota bacterium]